MVGKVISGSSFSGTVGYVMKKESRILEAEGIMPPEVKDMAQDFKDQTLLNPRLKNTVGHISLSFSPKDAPRMTDALMTQIAKEYMQKMGITDTQYLLARHLDQPHPHCHLVYNRVGNNGQTISDKNIKIRNAKVCRELTEKYGLYLAPGKDDVRRERLREPDKTRYEIHDAIEGCLPKMQELERAGRQIKGTGHRRPLQVLRKYRPQTRVFCSRKTASSSPDRRSTGLSALRNSTTGSTIFNSRPSTGPRSVGNLSAAAGNYRSAFAALFGSMGGGGTAREEPPSVNLGKAGGIPLPPAGSPVGVSAEQLQRKPGESPEEHIARITALLDAAAEAMAIAAMEHRRRLEEQKRRAKMKL